VHPASGGTITLNGEPLGKMSAHARAQRASAMCRRGAMIFPLLTVRENLETGYACLPRSEHHVPDEIYELFPVLKEMRGRRGGDLSGGQQQQLAIARAMILKPKVLLLDEPTEGIQPNIIQQIGRVIDYCAIRAPWRSCWWSSISTSPMPAPTASACSSAAGTVHAYDNPDPEGIITTLEKSALTRPSGSTPFIPDVRTVLRLAVFHIPG
jgi:hypothetical protein